MSELNEPWENELVSTLKEHEFSFDPAAWSSMDNLMTQSGIGAGNSVVNYSGHIAPADNIITAVGSTSKWTLGSLLLIGASTVTATLLLWQFTGVREEAVVVVEVPKSMPETLVTVELNEQITKDREEYVISQIRVNAKENDSTTATEAVEISNQEKLTERADSVAVELRKRKEIRKIAPLPSLPLKPLDFLKTTRLSDTVRLNVNPPKISRPTLFPDVQDRY